MNGMSSEELREHSAACRALLESRGAMLLSTLTPDGWPDISSAPYVRDEQNRFYIYLSALAAHTTNLQHHPVCSALFIADEQDSRNLFARERITLRCRVSRIERAEVRYSMLLDQLEQAHGKTVQMLRTLPDFELFELDPQEGSYVVGFGKAFELALPEFDLIHKSADRLKGR